MAVLVTGGAGYIGSHMAHALVDAGEGVVVLDDLSTGYRENLPTAARLVEGDIADRGLVTELIAGAAVTEVVHFAGSIIVPESVTDPLKYYLNNTAATARLLQTCVDAGVKRFIFSSTAAVYGEPDEVPIGEGAPLRPESPYGQSKRMSEDMLRDASRAYGLKHGILRYFNVAGADPEGRTGQRGRAATHLIKLACQAALGQRERLAIFGDDYPTPDGTGVRDYVHVCDLIEAHRLALQHLRGGGASFTANCGYGTGSSVREVVKALETVLDRPLPVAVEGRRPGDPATLVAGADRLRAMGWKPRYDDLTTIVRHAYEWEKLQSDGE